MLRVTAILLALAGTARAGELAGRIVDAADRAPVAGATVVVAGGTTVATATTDADGRFRLSLPRGDYDLLALYAGGRWQRHVTVAADGTTEVAGVLALGADVVTIHERAPAAAEVEPTTVPRRLPYSDEAIDTETWAVGWVLLDVDAAGAVSGFRFLHRPGRGLDDIAAAAIWRLRFRPARDGAGRPTATQVLWKLEWPAFHWAQDHQLAGTGGVGALAAPLTFGDRGFVLPGAHSPPCRGSGPLSLDVAGTYGPRQNVSRDAVYRDCSPPDLSAAASAPVIPRPQPADGKPNSSM